MRGGGEGREEGVEQEVGMEWEGEGREGGGGVRGRGVGKGRMVLGREREGRERCL